MASQKTRVEDEAPIEGERDPKEIEFNPWDAEFEKDFRKNDREFEF